MLNSSKIKAGCGALFLFSTGVVLGAIGLILIMAFFIPRVEGLNSQKSQKFLANHYSKKLKLTPEQQSDLKPGFEAFLEEKWLLRAEFLEANHQANNEYFQSIKKDLTPAQQQKVQNAIDRLWRDKRKQNRLQIKNAKDEALAVDGEQ